MINKVPRPVKIEITPAQARMLEDTLINIVREHFKSYESVGLGADFKTIVAVRDMAEVMAYGETISGTNHLTQVSAISITDIFEQINKSVE